MSQPSRFSTSAEAKANAWFSRRHETPNAHVSAQQKYRNDQQEKADRARALAASNRYHYHYSYR